MKKFLVSTVFAIGLLGLSAAHAAKIVIGQVGPQSGLDATQGRAYSAGMKLLFSSVNSAGGVNGHTFTLISKNDGGRAEDTVALTKQMIVENKQMRENMHQKMQEPSWQHRVHRTQHGFVVFQTTIEPRANFGDITIAMARQIGAHL